MSQLIGQRDPRVIAGRKTPVFGEADDTQPILPAPGHLLFFENVGRIVARGRVDENDVRSRAFPDLRFQRTETIESQMGRAIVNQDDRDLGARHLRNAGSHSTALEEYGALQTSGE